MDPMVPCAPHASRRFGLIALAGLVLGASGCASDPDQHTAPAEHTRSAAFAPSLQIAIDDLPFVLPHPDGDILTEVDGYEVRVGAHLRDATEDASARWELTVRVTRGDFATESIFDLIAPRDRARVLFGDSRVDLEADWMALTRP